MKVPYFASTEHLIVHYSNKYKVSVVSVRRTQYRRVCAAFGSLTVGSRQDVNKTFLVFRWTLEFLRFCYEKI